jgi:dihydroflavonol-4-reductase
MNGQATEFTTLLPGAVFGPILSKGNLGSVQIIDGLLQGRPPAIPRLGFWIVDVRDLADLHIRAMTSPDAGGQRFLAVGDFLWMEEIAEILRSNLGERGNKVPRRRLPNFLVRALLPFTPRFKTLAPLLGQRFPLSAEKARRVLGFSPRPAKTTLLDCAETLLAAG